MLTNATIGTAKRRILLDRFEKFYSDTYFTDVNIKSKLYHDRRPITDVSYYSVPDLERIPFSKLDVANFKPLQEKGDRSFGPSWYD
jgi:hypothetical protein